MLTSEAFFLSFFENRAVRESALTIYHHFSVVTWSSMWVDGYVSYDKYQSALCKYSTYKHPSVLESVLYSTVNPTLSMQIPIPPVNSTVSVFQS